jgi:hypothetical protein
MEHTVSMRIRRMREVLHIVDDSMLEAYAAGQAAALPPVHEIPERRVQVQNMHFCVLRMDSGGSAAGGGVWTPHCIPVATGAGV